MNSDKMIRVLVADDYPIVREGLAAFINMQKDMHVCWQAADGEEALHLFRLHQPDVTLMDLHMPYLSGIKATEFICAEFPAACILALTVAAHPNNTDRMLQAGAKACFYKDVDPDVILRAIRTLHGTLHQTQC